MGSFVFWCRWLITVSWVLVFFGVALAFFNQTPAFDFLFNDHVNRAFWREGEIAPNAQIFQQWIYGVLGAVLCGWAIFMAFLAQNAFPRKEPWAWWCLVLSVGVWFVVDSALSLYFGVMFNALFNLLLLVGLGLPLVAARKHFV